MIRKLSLIRIILASNSPRRAELLARIIPRRSFVIRKSRVRETIRRGETPRDYAERLAEAKALAVARRERLGRNQIAIIIGADTVIALGGKIIGQPRDSNHARAILGRLSGRSHNVITALSFIRLPERRRILTTIKSAVWMRKLDPETIDRYVRSGDPLDKAGAYGIQGVGRKLIRKYRGSYSNIVGFPLLTARKILRGLMADHRETE
jgi:septum formation protein